MTAFLAFLAAATLLLQATGPGLLPVLILLLVWFAAGLVVPWVVFARDD